LHAIKSSAESSDDTVRSQVHGATVERGDLIELPRVTAGAATDAKHFSGAVTNDVNEAVNGPAKCFGEGRERNTNLRDGVHV
jgi:hypothetical protein